MPEIADIDNKEKLLEVLVSGCDERIFLRPDTQANKYHLNPLNYEGIFHRGSCTCGTLTPSGYEVATKFLQSFNPKAYQQIIDTQTTALKKLLDDGQNNFDVFYGPSGSDMMYLPIIFQALLFGRKDIINIVSCPEELGSGSKAAAEGLFYSEWNQFGRKIPMGEEVAKNIKSKVFYLAARENSGHISNRSRAIRKIIAEHPNQPIIGNLVFGSKSGIKDDLEIIDEFKEGIMWVVDMCQFRTDTVLIHSMLDKGVMLMVTGSKFYQSPPFCGALLVPKSWTEKICNNDASIIKGYEELFSAYDFPESCTEIRKQLSDEINLGLRMRWEIAIEEMKAYLAFPSIESNALIRRWNQVVTGRLAQSDYFQLMPNMELTNDSIVSFMVLANGKPLNNEGLKKLFDYLVLNEHEGLNGFKKVFLGQPVQYGEKSFIRFAIGSYSIRRQLANKRFLPQNDIKLIEIIENAVDILFP
jgi:hypothetical protein